MGLKIGFGAGLIAVWFHCGLLGQDSKLNTNLGAGPSIPVGATNGLVGASLNAVVGAGYNFTKHHSFVGQFMWAGLPPDKQVLLGPLWAAAGTKDISGSSNMWAVTANYRYRMQERTFGAYLIGGVGWYYRRSSLSREVAAGEGTVCGPSWEYWGYGCVSGTVMTSDTIASKGSNAVGGNAGIGFTI
ncbi:MAG TPA: hypothetical protein VGF59_29250, partial [Bryobacteraceae bacterium]